MTWRCRCGSDMHIVAHRLENDRYTYRRRRCVNCGTSITTVEIKVEGARPGRGHGVLKALYDECSRRPEPVHRVAPPQRRPE